MYKVRLKQWAECQRIRNVISTVTKFLNNAIDDKKRAKKAKDSSALEQAKRDINTYEENLMELKSRYAKAEADYEVKALECAIKRTKVYVLSYSLQGAVFELREFLKQNAIEDEGEAEFCRQLTECNELLMKMPSEFGEYGKDNESYNICEEIISKSVDEGVRAVFDEMINQDLEKLKQKYGRKIR